MLSQKILNSRKDCYDYQKSLNNKINELISPLLQFNINRFFYGKFHLDKKFFCKTGFFLDSNLKAADWFCSNVVDNGDVYTTALRQTPLNQDTYFVLPKNSHDYIIKGWYTIGCYDGLTIYHRKNDSVEFWDFSSTCDSSLLSGNVINSQTLDVLLKFKAYLDNKFVDLDLQYQVKLDYPQSMNFSFLPSSYSKEDTYKVIECLQPYCDFININNVKVKLSKREWECWRLIALGQSVKLIASELGGISPRTVESYIETLKQKTRCYNRFSLAKLFLKHFKEWL